MVLFDPRNDPNTVPNANQDLLFKKYMQGQGANPTTPTQATDNLASINAKTNSTNVGNARTPGVPNLGFSKPTNTASLTGVKPVTTSKSTIAAPTQTLPDYSTGVTPRNINAVTQANMNNLQQNTIAGVEDIWKQHNATQGQLQMQQMIANNQTTNGLDVLRTQQSVQDQITQGITNPQQIANNTGIPLATVNQVLTGKDYQNVTLTQEAAKPIMTPLERLSQDVELAKKRNFEDMQTNIDRLTRDTTRAVDSLQAELARNIRSTQVAGALTSQSMASGFNIGIRNIVDGANENILRIKEGYADNIEDVQRLKNRMLEDYTMQMARATEDTKSNLDKLRLQTLSQLQDINEKFGINDDRTYTALQKLFQDVENSKLAIINNSADLMLRANADARANIDQVNKLQSELENFGGGYAKYNGQLMKYEDIAKMQAQGTQGGGSIWQTSKVMNLGNNKYNKPGTYTGHDFAAPFGSPIDSPVAGTITKVEKQKDGNNQVQIKTSDGFTVSINHVSDAILQYADQMIGQQVNRGDIIGYVGNSGNVMTADGKRLRKDGVVQGPEAQALLNQGRGSHMDVRIIDPNGKRVTGNNVVSFLQNGGAPIGQDKDGIYIFAPITQQQTQQQAPTKPTYNTKLYPLYRSYMENGKTPTAKQLSEYGLDNDTFLADAEAGYTDLKNRELKRQGFQMSDPTLYINLDPKTRTDLGKSIVMTREFQNALTNLTDKIEKNGLALTKYTDLGSEYSADIKKLQLKAKEIYNLGVLNGPDLGLMESILPDPTSTYASYLGEEQTLNVLKAVKTSFDNSINTTANLYGLEVIPDNTTQTSANQSSIERAIDRYLLR